ncbi:cytochrome C [Niabella ginsenosidivorans]|uniref:Cytochrome C n=1 Tax=Niabella ginsenosidivorans TaxID=1176587 RepID=A0A1A9HZK1_9BACT|nr:heme-binding domain-containing protein [Niabella ginsenosidivorans]ANH79890.1 cytochrome C [Niabella ginsenosidivorans]
MIKKIVFCFLVILIAIQFIRPVKNIHPGRQPNAVASKYPVPAALDAILKKACYDCHSNNTVYPWYNRIQPVYWVMDNHVRNGKRHLNFDEFTSLPAWRQYHKLDEIIEQVKENNMPLESYTWIHKDAVLRDAEKTAVYDWVNTAKTAMEQQYPKDSLIRPKK